MYLPTNRRPDDELYQYQVREWRNKLNGRIGFDFCTSVEYVGCWTVFELNLLLVIYIS